MGTNLMMHGGLASDRARRRKSLLAVVGVGGGGPARNLTLPAREGVKV